MMVSGEQSDVCFCFLTYEVNKIYFDANRVYLRSFDQVKDNIE
jgi:hypothetical protein